MGATEEVRKREGREKREGKGTKRAAMRWRIKGMALGKTEGDEGQPASLGREIQRQVQAGRDQKD